MAAKRTTKAATTKAATTTKKVATKKPAVVKKAAPAKKQCEILKRQDWTIEKNALLKGVYLSEE